jgi:hypothetical protein
VSDAVGALGATITIGGVPIEEARDIAGLELSTDVVDVTNHDSPGFGEEKLPTIKRFGNISFPMNALPAAPGQQALYAAWDDRSTDEYVVTYTNGVTATFDGLCIGFGLAAAVAGVNEVSVTITPKSAPTIAWGS